MSGVVEIEVAGITCRLRSDEGAPDLEAVAALVNERIGAIREAAADLPLERLAILAALNLGEELLRERARSGAEAAEIEAAVGEARSRLGKLAARVDAATKPDSDGSG